METEYTYIGVRIVSRLKELGMTQVQLSQKTGLSTTAMSSYCTGKRIPETSALHRLANALKTSMEWILTGKDATIENTTSEDLTFQALSCDGVDLSPMERDLVAMFRLLPRGARKEVFDLVHFKYSRLADGEKESIFWTYFDESSDEQSGPAESRETRDGTA